MQTSRNGQASATDLALEIFDARVEQGLVPRADG
jgi:hypothetical protein